MLLLGLELLRTSERTKICKKGYFDKIKIGKPENFAAKKISGTPDFEQFT